MRPDVHQTERISRILRGVEAGSKERIPVASIFSAFFFDFSRHNRPRRVRGRIERRNPVSISTRFVSALLVRLADDETWVEHVSRSLIDMKTLRFFVQYSYNRITFSCYNIEIQFYLAWNFDILALPSPTGAVELILFKY